MRWHTSDTVNCLGKICSSQALNSQRKVFQWAGHWLLQCPNTRKPSATTQLCGERRRLSVRSRIEVFVCAFLSSNDPFSSLSVKYFVGKMVTS